MQAPHDGPLARSISLLQALDDPLREQVLRRGIRRPFASGTVLFVQDEPCAGVFIVVRGLVKIARVSPEGREQVLRYVTPGGSFNEVPVLDGGPNAATATAVEDTETLMISRAAMMALIAETPEFAASMVQSLAGRLRHLVELVEDLSFRHVSERVARVLLQAVTPHVGVGAGADMRRRFSQREIAEMAGTSREVVARALKAIEASGAIAIDRGEITVVAPEKLAGLA